MARKTTAVAITLGTLLLSSLSYAQQASDVFERAQTKFAEEKANQDSVSEESREAADKALDNLRAERCSDKEKGILCDTIVLCSRAPEIAGERLPDDKELMAANQALDDVGDDLKKMASAIDQVKIASARFQKGARAARDRCEAKVRTAYRSEAASQTAKADPDEAVGADTPNEIYDGPVAIRPMVTAPRLMLKVPPTATQAAQAPSARP
jgi:hypothetical protein